MSVDLDNPPPGWHIVVEQLKRYQAEARQWKTAAERLRSQLFEWRNWSDEVAPPFGSARDRSDDGQREAIRAQLTAAQGALTAAQTALHDAMHAGHLSRAYHDGVIEKIDAALKASRP